MMQSTEFDVPQLRVLLAEENPVNQMFARHILEKLGHNVTIVENGQLAIDAISREKFDIVLMDIGMPVMNGYEAVAELRQRELRTGGHLPVIAVTANCTASDREQCVQAGMDDALCKPVRKNDLVAIMTRVLKDNSAACLAVKVEGAVVTGKAAPACDLETALLRLSGDEAFLKQLARLFLDSVPEQLQSLAAAIKDNNGPLASDMAHSIKGAVRCFCADTAYHAAQQLEITSRAETRLDVSKLHEQLLAEVQRVRTELQTAFPSLNDLRSIAEVV